MRNGRLLIAFGAAALLALAPQLPILWAADHGDAPGVRVDNRLDLNDFYAFQSPSTPGNVVFILTAVPVAGITSQSTFHPTADYDILVNTNTDPDFEFAFNFRFGAPVAGNVQQLHLVGESRSTRMFDIVDSTNRKIDLPGGGFVQAGLIDDPFFFDLIAFRAGLGSLCGPTRTGVNFFRGLNTMAIALEVPRSMFGTDNIGVWARTALNGQQIDRNGRPAINTVFMPAALKDAFNQGNPRDDQRVFRDAFTATARALGNSADRANQLADFLLPDLLTINTSSSDGFPNGRRLADDVIDIELNLVSGGALTSDCVANDSTFRTTFPYWAGPNP